MKIKFGLFTRLQFAFLAVISPQRLVTAITAGFLSAVESLEDDELRMLVEEINDAGWRFESNQRSCNTLLASNAPRLFRGVGFL